MHDERDREDREAVATHGRVEREHDLAGPE